METFSSAICCVPSCRRCSVLRGESVSQSQFEDLRDSNEITLFDDAFPAITGFELWIDQAFQWHYQSRDEPDGELRCIAAEAIKDATESRRRGSLEEAERLSGAAISADDMKLEPLAIRAARFAASKATAPASGSMAELAPRRSRRGGSS
jgi:hypothetical protein